MTDLGSKGDSGRTSQAAGAMAIVSRPSTKISVSQINAVEKMKNPYKMPKDSDIFKLREEEKKRKAEDRIRLRSLKVHEKTTQATRINFKTAKMIKPIESDDEQDQDDEEIVPVKEDPEFTLAVTRDRHIEKESLNDYITKKREMFLVQYSLGVKRDEMRKLEEIASAEEKKLEQAEQYLEEDAQMFDAFLKENDTNSVNAIQKAEAETKKKLEKLAEIKRVTAQMMTIKSEISKHEETLKEYQMYKRFLESLTPPEWLEQKALERKKRVEAKRKEAAADQQERASTASSRPSSKASRQNIGSRESKKRGRGGKTSASSRRNLPTVPGDDQEASVLLTDEDSDEEPELYFTDPQQLLDIFADLEEQNLSLIQNSQETEETLEDMKQNLSRTQKNMEKETKVLQDQINKLESAIEKEDVKATDLKMKAKMFNYGEFKSEDQENMLKDLKAKVEEVYRSTIGDNEANIETLQMLTNIENRLEELFELMETLPRDKVEEAEKKKEKERRLKAREDKMEQQKKHQEERVQKALERAQAAPKKQVGRRVMGRSEPPAHKQTDDDKDNQQSKEDEELAYYFT